MRVGKKRKEKNRNEKKKKQKMKTIKVVFFTKIRKRQGDTVLILCQVEIQLKIH